jgi:mono/diheme cytochrome c family protein
MTLFSPDLAVVSYHQKLMVTGARGGRKMSTKRLLWTIGLLLLSLLFISACGSGTQSVTGAGEAAETEHTEDEGDHHEEQEDTHPPEDHMAGMHGVPDEAAAVPNPIAADGGSVASGGALFAANCALCHGESGEGDGPAAAELDPKPADLHEAHVQELSDGALFYIISHGRPQTPMPPWENVLDVEQRWHVVNFLRTFGE